MILQQGNGWWKIAVNGGVGFMSADYLRAGHIRRSEGEALCAKAAGKQRIRRFFLHGTAGSLCGRQQPESARQAESAQQSKHPRHELRQVFQRHGGHDDFRRATSGARSKRPTAKPVYDDRLPFHSSASSSSSTRIVRHPQGTYVNLQQRGSKIRTRAGCKCRTDQRWLCSPRAKRGRRCDTTGNFRVYDDGVF